MDQLLRHTMICHLVIGIRLLQGKLYQQLQESQVFEGMSALDVIVS